MMQRARKLLRLKSLTAYDLTVLDCMVWCCRAPGAGQGRAIVPYTKLAKLTGICRPTVIQAVARLVDLGFIQKVARRVKAGWASRVAANLYLFVTESTTPPATKKLPEKRKNAPPPFEGSALDQALKRLYARMAQRPDVPLPASRSPA